MIAGHALQMMNTTLNKELSKNSHEKLNESRQQAQAFNARNSENMGSEREVANQAATEREGMSILIPARR